MTKEEMLKAGIGRRLLFLGRAADMISISLAGTEAFPFECAIHISATCEIYWKNQLLTCTQEIFIPSDENESTGWSQFDEKILLLGYKTENYFLQRLSYNEQHCLLAEFSNDLSIQSLSGKNAPCEELWRLFFPWKAEAYLVATQAGISLEYLDESQEMLDRQKQAFLERRKKRCGSTGQPGGAAPIDP